MDIRYSLLAFVLFIAAEAEQDATELYIEEDFGPPYIETARVKKLSDLLSLTNVNKLRPSLDGFNFTSALEKAMNFMTDRRDDDNSFDSVSFCFDSVVGSASKNLDKMKKQSFILSTLLVMKCVAATDAVVLPYNIYQDFKNAVTEFRRESSWTVFVESIFKFPFVMARTLMLQPGRTVARLSAVFFGSLTTYSDTYGWNVLGR